MSIFEKAVRTKVRFNIDGLISAEQLFGTRRTKEFIAKVQQYESDLIDQIAKLGNISHRRLAQKSEQLQNLELQLELVKLFLDEYEASVEEAKTATEKAAMKQQVLAVLAQKQDEDLKNLSVEQLKEMLKSL